MSAGELEGEAVVVAEAHRFGCLQSEQSPQRSVKVGRRQVHLLVIVASASVVVMGSTFARGSDKFRAPRLG